MRRKESASLRRSESVWRLEISRNIGGGGGGGVRCMVVNNNKNTNDWFDSDSNNNNVHLSCAHQRPERSHDTY